MRNAIKDISEYQKKTNRINRGKFYLNDMYQINELSDGNKWDCIANAMMFGFMVGYRFAKNEKKERR